MMRTKRPLRTRQVDPCFASWHEFGAAAPFPRLREKLSAERGWLHRNVIDGLTPDVGDA